MPWFRVRATPANPARVGASSASVRAKRGYSVVVKIAKAIAPEQPETRARIVIGPNIELVATEDLLSRREIVVADGLARHH